MAKGIHSKQNKRNKRIKAEQIKEFEVEQLRKLAAKMEEATGTGSTEDAMTDDSTFSLPSLGKSQTNLGNEQSRTEFNRQKKQVKKAREQFEQEYSAKKHQQNDDYLDTELVGLDSIKLQSNIEKKKSKRRVKTHKGVWRDESKKIGKDKMLEELTNKNKEALKETTAYKQENKNRYPNILPYDKNRVVLDTFQGAYESDFINASYINGPAEKYYICAQGPLPVTCEDFWRMVWDQKSQFILMLTQLWENDRIKCHRYWPEPSDKDNSYGNIIVKPVSEEDDTKRQLKIRKFQLTHKLDPEKTLDVTHYQFLGWKDHEVPEDIETVLYLGKLLDEAHKKSPVPAIVHCSAGIGRTGTFVVMHNILNKVAKFTASGQKTGFEFCIPQEIVEVRAQRYGMIQTKDQYYFLYTAVLHGARALGLDLVKLKLPPPPKKEKGK